ncbi:MAG TPA: hypothetical protein VHI13_18845 [Candidatus Kapabacteria bacterium]|nr:hypothetical protein [Candidatus Kapabacteria bacterium]
MSAQHVDTPAMETAYSPDLPMREARRIYFDRYGFINGGYDERWVKLKAGPIPIYFPNIPSRVVAAQYHDLHHVLTEYTATWIGEAEIGAWEVASGCRHHWPAWILNLSAMGVGMAIAPGRTYRAFIRGRSCGNLYALPFDDMLLRATVGSLRMQLGLNRSAVRSSPGSIASFVLWTFIAVIITLFPLLVVITSGMLLAQALG